MKQSKIKHKEAHSANMKYGMGDNLGTGVRNPIGKVRDVFGITGKQTKNMGKPPKSLA